MKAIRITMPDGSRWDVPAHAVADNRARYYSEKEGSGEEGYREEYEFTMEDRYELLDWAAGNMDWDDVAEQARRVDDPPADMDYQEGWINGEREIVEVDDRLFPSI